MEHSTSGVQLDLSHKCFIRPSCPSVISCWDKDSSNKMNVYTFGWYTNTHSLLPYVLTVLTVYFI